MLNEIILQPWLFSSPCQKKKKKDKIWALILQWTSSMMKDKVTFLSFDFPIYEAKRPYKADRERIENLPITT